MKRTLTYNGVTLWCKLYDPDTVRRVLNAYQRGAQPSAISERYGVPVSRIETWTERVGIRRSKRDAARIRAREEKGVYAPEMKPLAESLYLETGSVQETADRMGVSYTAVYDWLRQRGVIRKSLKGRLIGAPKDVIEPLRRRALAMYAEGYDSGTISDLLDLSQTTVLQWVRKAGLLRKNANLHSWNSPLTRRGMKRREQVREAWRLRSEGLTNRQIAERMSVSGKTVSAWFRETDPFRFDLITEEAA